MYEDSFLEQDYEDRQNGGLDLVDWNDDPNDFDEPERDDEPDIGFQFEHDSAMESIGWGDDDCAAYGGGEDF